jgi:hypothetical protein
MRRLRACVVDRAPPEEAPLSCMDVNVCAGKCRVGTAVDRKKNARRLKTVAYDDRRALACRLNEKPVGQSRLEARNHDAPHILERHGPLGAIPFDAYDLPIFASERATN